MKRVSIVLIALAMLAVYAEAQVKGNAREAEAIKGIAQKWQDSWNRHDMKALATLVAENVDFILTGGAWQKSRKEFEEHHVKLHLIRMKDSVWATKNTEVKFVRSDVAVAHVEWGFLKGDTNRDGTPREPREGIMTWVLEKRKGGWIIIASQNTNIREPVPVKEQVLKP